MASAAVVEALDVADDVPTGALLWCVRCAVNALVFRGRKESFSLAVVPAIVLRDPAVVWPISGAL